MDPKKSIKMNEEGSALVLSMMVLLVLSLLGTVLAAATMGQYQLNTQNRSSVAAYYVAEGVMNEKYSEIETMVYQEYENHTNRESFFQAVDSKINEIEQRELSSEFYRNFNDDPTANVAIEPSETGESLNYVMTVEGQVGQRKRQLSQTITINWQDKGGGSGVGLPELPANAAGFVRNSMELGGSSSIRGDIYFDSTIPQSIDVSGGGNRFSNGNLYHSSLINGNDLVHFDWGDARNFNVNTEITNYRTPWNSFESIVNASVSIPLYSYTVEKSVTTSQGDIFSLIKNRNFDYTDWNIQNIDKLVMDDNLRVQNFNIGSNMTLKIDTQNQDWDIVVDNLNVPGGHIEIYNGGTINLYVLNEIKLGRRINTNDESDTSQLNIYYSGSSPVNIVGSDIDGSLFVENEDSPLHIVNSRINGFVLTRGPSVTFSNNSFSDIFLLAPYANVELLDKEIRGLVIAERFEITGSSLFIYKEMDLTNFPFAGQQNEEIDPSELDLIHRGPLQE